MRIDDLDHLPETTTIDASSIGIVQVSPAHVGPGTPHPRDPGRRPEQPLGKTPRFTLVFLFY